MEICVQVSTQALWVQWRAADDMFNVEGSTEASHPVAIYVSVVQGPEEFRVNK